MMGAWGRGDREPSLPAPSFALQRPEHRHGEKERHQAHEGDEHDVPVLAPYGNGGRHAVKGDDEKQQENLVGVHRSSFGEVEGNPLHRLCSTPLLSFYASRAAPEKLPWFAAQSRIAQEDCYG